jgi:hypothetical protein
MLTSGCTQLYYEEQVIGLDITEQLGRQSLPDAKCAPDERIVRVARKTLVAAKKDIVDI